MKKLLSSPAFRAFVPLLVLFVALRILQAASAVNSFDREDGFTITAAWELLNHNVWPYQAYQISNVEGGSLVMVLLCLPFCLLFGPSLFALKLTAIVVSCVTLTGVFLLAREVFGLRAALLACLLYIFFPSPIHPYSMTAHGFHPDSMAVQVLFIWGMARCYNRPPSGRRFFWTGALGGFAGYFAYISAFAVLAALAPWMWRLWRPWRRRPEPRFLYGPFVAGALCGGLPLIVYNVLNQLRGLHTYRGSVLSYLNNPMIFSERVTHFLDHTMGVIWDFSSMKNFFREPFPAYAHHPTFNALFWAAAAAALVFPFVYRLICWRRGVTPAHVGRSHWLDLFAVWFVGVTLAIILASAHPIFPWHLVPMLVLLLVVIAGRAELLWARGGLVGKAAVGLALAAFLGNGLWLHVRDVHPRWMGYSLVADGRNYDVFFTRALEALTQAGLKAERDAARDVHMAYASRLALNRAGNPAYEMRPSNETLDPILAAPAPLDALRQYIRRHPVSGARVNRHRVAGVVLFLIFDRKKIGMDRIKKFISGYSGTRLAVMLRAFGAAADSVAAGHHVTRLLQRARAPASWLEHVTFGMGQNQNLMKNFHWDRVRCTDKELPRDLAPAFFRGLGYGTAQRLCHRVPRSFGRWICTPGRAHFWQGVARFGKAKRRWLSWGGVLEGQ